MLQGVSGSNYSQTPSSFPSPPTSTLQYAKTTVATYLQNLPLATTGQGDCLATKKTYVPAGFDVPAAATLASYGDSLNTPDAKMIQGLFHILGHSNAGDSSYNPPSIPGSGGVGVIALSFLEKIVDATKNTFESSQCADALKDALAMFQKFKQVYQILSDPPNVATMSQLTGDLNDITSYLGALPPDSLNTVCPSFYTVCQNEYQSSVFYQILHGETPSNSSPNLAAAKAAMKACFDAQ